MKRAVLLLVLALATVAPGARSLRAQTQVPAPPGFPTTGEPPIVRLVSPGAAPRRALRLALPVGHRDHASMDMTMSLSLSMAGADLPAIQMPTLHMAMDLTVTDVTAGGDATYNLAATEMKWVNPESADPMIMSTLQKMILDPASIKGAGTVSNRGIVRNAKMDTGAASDPQMAQIMNSMSSTIASFSVPFPDEAVGVGARWEVFTSTQAGGVHSFQKSTVELTAADAARCALKVSIEQSAPPQPMTAPGMPAGTTATLDKMSGSGTTTISQPFDSLAATTDGSMSSSMAMTIDLGGQTQPVTVQVSIKASSMPVK